MAVSAKAAIALPNDDEIYGVQSFSGRMLPGLFENRPLLELGVTNSEDVQAKEREQLHPCLIAFSEAARPRTAAHSSSAS